MKQVVTYTILVIFCFILQATVFRGLAFAGIVPNLMVILCASLGFMSGDRCGLIVGFGCGLLVDIFFGDVIGFHALLYMYIGYLNGKLSGRFYPENIKLPMILILASDLFYGLLSYALLFMLRGRLDFGHYFRYVIFPEVIYTILVTLLLYPLVLWVNYLLDGRRWNKGT